jgi:hypothetical protein
MEQYAFLSFLHKMIRIFFIHPQLGTLGEARGKLTLLQRFSWSLLPSGLDKRFGIYLDAGQWTDNGKNIELTYNAAQQQVAYIEVEVTFLKNRLTHDEFTGLL